MKFTKKQIERYSRQIILKKIGVIGQKKLLKSSVLIVGAGGLGSPIAIYLTALGIGKIGIIDKDNIEISNLSRQIIFSTNDIKKNKSSTAISKLKKLNPDIQFKSFNKKLTKKNVCDQTAKYNNGKAFSRPTLDSYIEVANYISKTKPFNNITLLKEKDKKSTQRIEELNQIISQLQEEKQNLAFENYQLQEKIKFLENN